MAYIDGRVSKGHARIVRKKIEGFVDAFGKNHAIAFVVQVENKFQEESENSTKEQLILRHYFAFCEKNLSDLSGQ